MNRNVTLIGVVAGGVLTAMALSAGSASADNLLPDGPSTTPGNYGLNNPNPFGLTPIAAPDITGMTGQPWDQHVLSGTQVFDFDSQDVAPFIQDFLTKYVTVDGQPYDPSSSYLFGGLTLPVIDTMGFYTSEQHIILPPEYFENAGTNIDWGVINIHNWGNFFGPWGYVYVDLVGAGTTGPTDDAIGTWFTTPFGAFDVSWLENGSIFGSPYVESQLFDVSDFNPGANWDDTVTIPGPLFP